jgi:hypothetical protein
MQIVFFLLKEYKIPQQLLGRPMLLGVKRGNSLIHIPLMIMIDSSFILMSLDNGKNDKRTDLTELPINLVFIERYGVFFFLVKKGGRNLPRPFQ